MLSEISSSEPVVAEEVEQRESSHSQSDYLKWYLFGGLVLGGGALALSGGGRKGGGSNAATHSHQTKENVQSPASQIDKGQTQPTKDNVQSSASQIDQVQMGQSQSDKLQVDKPADSAEKEVLAKPQVEQKPILIKSYQYDDSLFKNDTDKDGLFDALDPNPTMWNVSERDLRTFTTLSYKDEKELKAIFDNKNLKEWQEINLDKESGLNNSFSEKESEDFIQNWALIEFKNTSDFLGSGLDYSVFGNGKKSDGTYQQIVFAFRGSKGSYTNLQDWYTDLKVLRGDLPTQAKELVGQTKAIVDKYSPDTVYATGHSLGGYLTQYFTAYAMQASPEFQAKMKHSAIFNPLLLLTDKDSDPSLIKARENTDRFVKEAISNDDVMSGNFLYKTSSYIIDGEFLADGGVPRDKAKKAGIIGGGVAGTIVGGLLALVTGGLVLQLVHC